MGLDIIGINLEGSLILNYGFFQVPSSLLGYSQIKMCLGELGVNTDRFFILCNLLFPSPLPSVDYTQIEVGSRIL